MTKKERRKAELLKLSRTGTVVRFTAFLLRCLMDEDLVGKEREYYERALMRYTSDRAAKAEEPAPAQTPDPFA